mgnify:CR=1 FL=1
MNRIFSIIFNGLVIVFEELPSENGFSKLLITVDSFLPFKQIDFKSKAVGNFCLLKVPSDVVTNLFTLGLTNIEGTIEFWKAYSHILSTYRTFVCNVKRE